MTQSHRPSMALYKEFRARYGLTKKHIEGLSIDSFMGRLKPGQEAYWGRHKLTKPLLQKWKERGIVKSWHYQYGYYVEYTDEFIDEFITMENKVKELNAECIRENLWKKR